VTMRLPGTITEIWRLKHNGEKIGKSKKTRKKEKRKKKKKGKGEREEKRKGKGKVEGRLLKICWTHTRTHGRKGNFIFCIVLDRQ